MAIRRTARMVVMDEQDRVLLIKIEDKAVHDPSSGPKKKPFWITPGGKIEEGEDVAAALERELQEETGIVRPNAEFGSMIWVGEHDLNWKGVPTHMHESYFLVRVKNADISLDGMTADEKDVYKNHMWWAVPEMRASGEIFLPKDLPELLEPIVRGQIPSAPVTIDMSTPKELSQ